MGKRNLVLVCLDTVRKDVFDEYAPRLQARADVVYEQCRAASSWSAPSHASMFTGTLPHEHGVHAYHRDFSGLSREDAFLGDLPDHRALGVSANVWAGSSFGFDGLFDDFSDISPDRRFPEGIDVARFGQNCEAEGVAKQVEFLREALAHDHPLYSLANGALVELDNVLARAPVPKLLDDGANTLARQAKAQIRRTDEPFVQFINFMDAHGPLHHVFGYDRAHHDAPNGWTSESVDWARAVAEDDRELIDRYEGLYAASIDYLDRKVCELVDGVRAATDRETTFVITADHGDNLGTDADEGLWGHVDSSLSEGLLHVPCVVLNAPGSEAIREDRYLSHLRLGDLLVGLANGEVPDVGEDRIAAERIGHSGKVHTLSEKSDEQNRMIRCVYEDERKRCWDSNGDRESYRLDPSRPCWQETIDEPVDVPALEAEFFERDTESYYRRVRERADEGPAVDDVVSDRLRRLGYM